MKYLWIGSFVLLVTTPAAAQPPRPDRTAMYEDVEVMRRLLGDAILAARPQATYNAAYISSGARYVDPLNASLLRTLGPTAIDWGSPYIHRSANTVNYPLTDDHAVWSNVNRLYFGVSAAERPAPATDGTYVKGIGVLLTLQIDLAEAAALEPPTKSTGLAANCSRCHGSAMEKKVQPPRTESKPEAADPWDAKLRQIRGEKDPAAPSPPSARLTREEICVPGSLTELLMGQLAQYGHRFRELPAGEAIAVVVTLKAPTSSNGPPAEPTNPVATQAEEQLALGDLHAKQGKIDDAIRAYQKAIDELSKPLRFSESTAYDQAATAIEKATKSLRNAHAKLAPLLLEQGKFDEAKAAIEAGKAASVRIEAEAGKKRIAPGAPLPIKLMVRVPKKVVDDHKSGKLSFDEFRAAAEVEAVGFPTSSAKPRP